jgi:hypothetical protein
MALPGETAFNDVRGADHTRRSPDLPANLPGQTRDPSDTGEATSLDSALRK